ncbi:DUF899 family protein [Nonomuraea sp. NPDC051941]|uniref:DUF899 family protein n=1 Tax=Nonomuraea sp. NPDC051941 TaxID=3364373 RepID=UPI0037C91919
MGCGGGRHAVPWLALGHEVVGLEPSPEAVCVSRSRDVTLISVSRAPLEKINAYKRRMGWRFTWVSSNGSDFNYDYRVSFTPEQQANGATYNFRPEAHPAAELPGMSAFALQAGTVYHTYSSYARGAAFEGDGRCGGASRRAASERVAEITFSGLTCKSSLRKDHFLRRRSNSVGSSVCSGMFGSRTSPGRCAERHWPRTARSIVEREQSDSPCGKQRHDQSHGE